MGEVVSEMLNVKDVPEAAHGDWVIVSQRIATWPSSDASTVGVEMNRRAEKDRMESLQGSKHPLQAISLEAIRRPVQSFWEVETGV